MNAVFGGGVLLGLGSWLSPLAVPNVLGVLAVPSPLASQPSLMSKGNQRCSQRPANSTDAQPRHPNAVPMP